MSTVDPMGIRELHDRLGRVNSQPVGVTSFTNKRFTVNFRVPLEELKRVLPDALEVEEVRDTGMGMIGMCACDFAVTKLAGLPVPPIRNNDMLCRASVKIRKGAETHRAYYTLRSDSSSRFLGLCGSHFSHFRKATSKFSRVDDGAVYSLSCEAEDPLCSGYFKGEMDALSKHRPDTTMFADIQDATDFLFQLDGSCGYNYDRDMLSFQKIDFPAWDLSFCHKYEYSFTLMDYLFRAFDLHPTLDCVLFMEKVPQVWRSAWMYRNVPLQEPTPVEKRPYMTAHPSSD